MIQLKSLIASRCLSGIAVEINCPIYLAYQIMSADRSPCLVVVSNNEVMGIVERKSYIEMYTSEQRMKPIHQIMNQHYYFASPEYELDEAIRLMQKYDLQVLPVVDKKTFLGVFTYVTLLDCLAIQNSDMIKNLFTYITGLDNFEPYRETLRARDLIKN